MLNITEPFHESSSPSEASSFFASVETPEESAGPEGFISNISQLADSINEQGDRRESLFHRFFPFFLFLLECLVLSFFQNLNNTDKLWNYMFAENIASGLLPYRDFNLLQTPFSCLVNAVFLALFGHHMIIIEILGALLFTGICTVLYKTCRMLGASPFASCIIPQSFLMLFSWNFFFEYSCLILCLQLILLWADLSRLTDAENRADRLFDRYSFQFLMGVLGGLAMMSKQTFGTFVAGASWISIIAIVLLKKENRKLIAFRIAGTFLPNFIFLFYLLFTGTFGDFWDMSIAGVSTFTSTYSYLLLAQENGFYLFGCIAAPLLILISLIVGILKRKTVRGQVLLIILLYGGLGLINMIPMSNFYHFSTCLIPFLLLIPALLPRRIWKLEIVSFACEVYILAVFFYSIGYIPYDVLKNNHLCTDIYQFEGIFISDEMEEDIKEVTSYIKEKEDEGYTVYVLDNRAGSYFLPLDEYHKYFDMFLVGNMGTSDPYDLLVDACEDHVIFLCPNDTKTEWQYPWSAVRKIKGLLKQSEEVGDFIAWYCQN